MDETRAQAVLGNGGRTDPSKGDRPATEPTRLVAAWDVAIVVNRVNWSLQIGLLRLDEFSMRTMNAEYGVASG